MFEEEGFPWSVSVPLAGGQMDEISDIVLRRPKLPLWPDLLMDPNAPMDMDGWFMTFTYHGKLYKKRATTAFPPA